MDVLNNTIIGINELYVCKYLLDLDLTLMNNWRDNYYLESDYNSKTKLSIIFSFAYSKYCLDKLKEMLLALFKITSQTWIRTTEKIFSQ